MLETARCAYPLSRRTQAIAQRIAMGKQTARSIMRPALEPSATAVLQQHPGNRKRAKRRTICKMRGVCATCAEPGPPPAYQRWRMGPRSDPNAVASWCALFANGPSVNAANTGTSEHTVAWCTTPKSLILEGATWGKRLLPKLSLTLARMASSGRLRCRFNVSVPARRSHTQWAPPVGWNGGPGSGSGATAGRFKPPRIPAPAPVPQWTRQVQTKGALPAKLGGPIGGPRINGGTAHQPRKQPRRRRDRSLNWPATGPWRKTKSGDASPPNLSRPTTFCAS